ncbi:Ig-like domain-containing protein, partial [Ulvibacter antarcticus]
MHNITYSTLHKRIIYYLSAIVLMFSSVFVYGQAPLPTIVPNSNRGLPFLYALPDNSNDLYAVAPNPNVSPLPNPTIVSCDRTFDGEGAGFRATDRMIYAFDDDHDLYRLNPSTGVSTKIVDNMFTGRAQGVDFYLNNNTGDEILFVIVQQSGDDGVGGEKLFAFNPNNSWAAYAGFPKTINGAIGRVDGIAWDPASGNFYVQEDDLAKFYTINVTNATTTFAFSTSTSIDGEGISFAADGKLYTEDESYNGISGSRRLLEVNLLNGQLTPVAQLGGSSDVEAVMGNVGVRDDGGDIPASYGWAAHQLPVLLSTPITRYLGNVAPDSEDPFSTINGGFGDDSTGIDDEDGVKLDGDFLDNKQLNVGQSYTLTVKTNGSGAVLNAWIDWNGDGDFDSNEQVADDVIPSGGNINLNITVPANATLGVTYSRFRYSTLKNLPPSYSEAPDGEVEDYKLSIVSTPIARDCTCAPFYENSNFVNPVKIAGNNLQVGAVYRFSNVFPGNPYGTTLDALVKIEAFNGGASLLDIDVTSSGLPEAFQPRINSTNSNDQSVEFSITFVSGGGNYGDEVLISFFGTPLDIDGDQQETREYAEVDLGDAYFLSANTNIDISRGANYIRGEARTVQVAPGGDISLDPKWTFSNYYENKTGFTYKIGKIDGDSDRYYSLDMDSANYTNPESVLITYPVICGNVSDEGGDPLVGVPINVTGTDGSAVSTTTDSNGNYKVVATIPEALVNVDYSINETDLPGYISISDVDGANDNLISRTINLMSTCGNDFVDGVNSPTGWNFECGDDKIVDEYGYNANCNTSTVVSLPNPSSIYEYVVEIVYKGSNPGQSLTFTDSNGTARTLLRSVPVGGSSNIWVYRGLINGTTSSVTYNTTSSLSCKLQSVVVYAFRNQPLASSSSGVFTSRSGYNDIQTIQITIPAFTGPRNLEVEMPISELTDDGRYLKLTAEAGGVSQDLFIYGPDASLPGGTCCLAIPVITLNAVPGAATTVTLTVDSRNGQNGQTVNGQSWVIASGVNVDGDCYEELELTLDNKVDILCNGDATGSITVAATGGLAPLQYSLNGGTPQASPEFTGLTAGSYTVTVTDALGNTASITVTLNEPEAISIIITKVNATQSQGCLNGQATATPSGGTPPFTYLWSASAGSQTTQTATNLPAGTHTVVVTDANDCILEQGVVIDCINNCDAVVTVDSTTNVLCAGELTGSATVSASSVANPGATFTFTWNTGDIFAGVTTSTLNNIGAGVYTVSVTIDGTVCLPVEQSVTITEPSNALNVTATSTDENGPTTGDGTATANPSGGTPPYTYSWSPGGQTTQTITGLSAGVYTVTVTDANGCTATASTTVNPGTCMNLAATASATPVSCNGNSDGTATVGVTGGSGTFTYSWSPGGQTTQSITGLTAGVYTVTVTDSVTLCTTTSTATVNQPGVLSSGIAITNVNCFGNNSGSLDLTVTGGTAPYTFVWAPNGETTEDLFNLVAGTYSVTITDARGCVATNSATVLQPSSGLTISTVVTDVLCNGDATGAIDVTVGGGTPPYSYVWSNGTTTEDLSNIVAGTYTVNVTDSNGCTISASNVVVAEPANALSIVITKENATTGQGCTDGEATATVSGGTPGYTYLWSASAGGQTTATATNLPAGTHSVTVTDSNGCVLTQGVVIDCSNTCDAIVVIDSKTDVLCTGDTTGSATVSASSIANPGATFTFTWNTVPAQVDAGVTTSTTSGLAAGVYTVSVTIDGTVCSPVEQSVTITEPTNALNVTATATDESGPTTGDGTATANPSGGTPPYTYVWSPGGETTQTITGLSAGTYSVTVTDANGCTATATVTVNPGTCLDLMAFAASTPVTCNGDSDGTATATVTGGSGSFTYSWSNGATTAVITGLSGGSYTVTVTDTITLCTSQATITVGEPNILSSGIAITNVNCFGNNSGSLDLTVTGGTAPYTFVWAPNGETTEDLFNLVAGTYSVTITDARGCVATNSATVLQPSSGLTISTVVTDVLCNGDATGAIDVTVGGGTPPYSYAWSNGATTEDLSNIVAGTYTVNVTDANGCTISASNVVVAEPANALSIVITKENATTGQGCTDGEATATVSGGTPGYTYLWSASAGGQTTATATNLPAGTHSVTVTDSNGCVLTQGVVIDCSNTCDAIVVIDSKTDVLCTGDTTGSATVSASSIANPGATFTFTWNTVPAQVDAGVTTSTTSGLAAGVYTVSVTIDGTVCSPVEQSVTITEPTNALNVTATATDESGPTTGDGTATANPSGGTPPYTYVWSPGGETTQTITGLSAGTYSVTVTDANGCTATATVTVNPGTCLDLMAFAASTPVTCNGDSDGTATATVTGGSGSFTYLWSNGATTAVITGLSGGAYTVTVTDTVTLCTSDATTTVNEPNILSSGIAVTNVDCFGNTTGSLDLTVSGGTAPYTFVWAPNGETTEDLFNLVAGTYSVTITDARGCVATNSATITQPTAGVELTIVSQTDIVCTGTGSVTVAASGGTTPYLYNIDGGAYQASGTFDNLTIGVHPVNVLDANGCTATIDVTILTNCILAIDDINNTFVNIPVDGDVSTNDQNPDGPAGTEVFTLVTGPSNGTLTLNADGTYTYTPNLDFVGEDTFVYQICDAGNPIACDTATVYIEIQPLGSPANEPPVANADTNTTEVGVPVSGTVLSNDFDPDGDPIVVTANTQPANGTVVMNPDGTYTYTPNPGFEGEDTFEYTICDDGTPQLCDTATVTIQV